MVFKQRRSFNRKIQRYHKKLGFDGVLEELRHSLVYGSVTELDNGLYRVTTGGWSEDEELLDSINNWTSMFGYKHYVGSIRGGAFYFTRHTGFRSFEIIDDTEDRFGGELE